MAGIFSHRFLTLPYGQNGIYTVPAGQVAVVRCVTVFNANASNAETYQLAVHSPQTPIVWGSVPPYKDDGVTRSVVLDLRVAFTEGEAFETANGVTTSMTVSGYLFTP